MDLDADGRHDVISGSWPGEVYWFRGNADGSFGAPTTNLNGRSTVNVGKASAVAVSDWDKDGDFDLLIGTIDGYVFLVKNEGSKTKPLFSKREKLNAGGKEIKTSLGDAGPCVADWDGDGTHDLLLGAGAGGVEWCRRMTDGKLEASVSLVAAAPKRDELKKQFDSPKGPGTRTKICIADWNGDGKQDLLVGDFHSGGSRNYHGWVWVFLRREAATAAGR